jgi:hypothetical protein
VAVLAAEELHPETREERLVAGRTAFSAANAAA